MGEICSFLQNLKINFHTSSLLSFSTHSLCTVVPLAFFLLFRCDEGTCHASASFHIFPVGWKLQRTLPQVGRIWKRRSPEVGWKNLLKLSAFCVHTHSHQVKQEESAMAEQREVIDIIVVIFHIIVQFVVYLMFSMPLLNYQQAGWKTGQKSICSRNSRVG